MKTTSSTAALVAWVSLSLVAARVDISSIPLVSSANVIPGAYIVEIDPHTVGVSAITGKRSINVRRPQRRTSRESAC